MRIILILLIFLAVGACSTETMPPLVASDVNVTAPMPGMSMSAGYIVITNNTNNAIGISRVESPDYESVEIHESILEDGIAKMRQLDVLNIPANSAVTLERGGKHLMLMRPSGTSNQVSLNFYDGETLLLGVTTTPSKGIN
jgi:copper(I)-binding protein